jgi:predicted molibdopterin-dependent oxidoreductase YjgC
MSLGSRGDELMRIVARDRYVNGHNGEFLCIKGRFAHPFVNHAERLKTPLIRYKKGGRLIPATWDDALRFVAQKLDAIAEQHGPDAIGVVGTPRATNESLYALYKFATDTVGTKHFAATDAFSLQPFFDNLGGPIATHHNLRHAQTILLIGGEPEELQPFAGKQIRQAVRNGGAKLIIVNRAKIRLTDNAAQFVHVRPGAEDAFVLALADKAHDSLAAQKAGLWAEQIAAVRDAVNATQGNVVILFGGELSAAAQAVVAQLPQTFAGEGRRVMHHPLPLYNNSVGAHDIGFMRGPSVADLLNHAGGAVKALHIMGSLLPEHDVNALGKLDFLVVQEMFATTATAFADAVLPACSFAETDGTFTNSGGLVQRVRQSIAPVHQSKADWLIIEQLAHELGVDMGFQRSASAIFREIAAHVLAYAGLGYPALKDESRPAQAAYTFGARDVADELKALREAVGKLDETVEKITGRPKVGHKLFTPGTLTGKTPQFHYLAEGNEMPATTAVSPLYQISTNSLSRARPAAGD